MQSTLESINSVQLRLRVNIAAEKVDSAFSTAYRKYQKDAHLKGFRPGKAPKEMVEKYYGQSIAADVGDGLIRTHLFEAIEQNNIRAVGAPELEEVTLPKKGETFSFSAVVDILPEFKLGEYKGISVSVPPPPNIDALLQEHIAGRRKKLAKVKTLSEDQPAEKGQRARFDQIELSQSKNRAPFNASDLVAEVGVPGDLPAIGEALLGMKVGDAKEVSVDLGLGTVAGAEPTPIVLKIEVKEIFEQILPALDDEFARDLGYETYADMEVKLREQFVYLTDKSRQSQLDELVGKTLVDAHNFEVPPALVAREIDDMIRERTKDQSPADQKRAAGDKEIRRSFIEIAKARLKWMMIIGEIIKQENIEVVDADLQAYVDRFKAPSESEDQTGDEATASALKNMRELLEKNPGHQVFDSLRFQKAAKLVADSAKIEFKK